MPRKPRLSQHLKQSRERAGLTAAEAARQIGIARTAYRLWEMGSAYPEPNKWRKSAEFAGLSITDILFEVGVYTKVEYEAVKTVEGLLRNPALAQILRAAVKSGHMKDAEAEAILDAAKLLD